MNRLDRRIRLLRGRDRVPFDTDQRQLEQLPRARTARRARVAIRQGRPVIVRHARWSAVSWWLEDLTTDLAVASPTIQAVKLDLRTIGRSDDAWVRIPELIQKALGAPPSTVAEAPSTREAFRHRIAAVFLKSASSPPSALLLPGADSIGYEALQDLCDGWRAARHVVPLARMPRLLISCRIGGQSLMLDDAESFFLADPSHAEAERMLAELLGAGDPQRLSEVVDAVGVVPGFLMAVARAGAPTEVEAVREALGPLHRELAQVVEIVRGQETLGQRLDALSFGSLPKDDRLDRALLRAGLVLVHDRSGATHTSLRTPLVAELLQG